MSLRVKICGLETAATIAAAAEAGAAYVGFVSFPKSPRHRSLAEIADLAVATPPGLCKVVLTVNAGDEALDRLMDAAPLDMIQLHGAESPERVAQVRERYGLPVMKAIGVADEGDLAAIDDYARAADQLLIDAKPPKGAPLPGGTGLPFDWRLLQGRRWATPWMLAGGLTAANLAEAVRLTGARQVDLSSGVESAPGVKDPDRIRAFCAAAQVAALPA